MRQPLSKGTLPQITEVHRRLLRGDLCTAIVGERVSVLTADVALDNP